MKFFLPIFIVLCFSCGLSAQETDTAHVPSGVHTKDTVKSTNAKRPNWDIRLFTAINSSRKPFYDFVVPITDRAIFPAAIGIPPLLFFAGRLSDKPYDENSAVISGFSAVTTTAVSLALKYTLKRERPFTILDSSYYNDKNSLTDRYSFPSGHTSTAFSLATSVTLRYPDNPVLISGLYLHALVVGFGRMYLGVHYPSDVISGAFIGAGSAVLMYSLRKEIVKLKNNVFNEEDVKDEGSNKFNQYSILGAVILSDIINYIIYNSDPLKKRGRIDLTSDGKTNYLRFTYSF